MRIWIHAKLLPTGALLGLIVCFSLTTAALADTTVTSANSLVWDVQDNTGVDDGGISDGGNDAFDSWGKIRVRVTDSTSTVIVSDQELSGFGLTFDGNRAFDTTTPVSVGGLEGSRSLVLPAGTDYARYVDTFTNTGSENLTLELAWGGGLGSDSSTTISRTSSGDMTIDATDAWALTIENSSSDPNGPATDPPVGYLFQDPQTGAFASNGDYHNTPFDTAWPGNGNDDISFVYAPVTLAPGETVRFAYFLYRGREEETAAPDGTTPAAGEEIALAETVLGGLAASPDFSGLSGAEVASIVNFTGQAATPTAVPIFGPSGLLVLIVLFAAFAVIFLARPSLRTDA